MSNLRDFTGKNRKFTGTTGITVSDNGSGAGDRVNEKGRLRFNDTTDLLEYYNGNDWKSIDAPPVITGFTLNDIGGTAVTSASIDNEASGTSTIEILGSLFDTTGSTVSFVGSGETISTQTITRNSANKLTVTVTNSDFDVTNGPYTIKVTNGSGLSAELAASVTADQTTPTFTNSADTVFSVYDQQRSSGTIAAADLCGASDATAYAVQSGSLPTGFTLNTTSGAITWSSVSAVGSDTTSTFTIRATGDDATADRQFKITVKAPIRSTYNSTGSFNHTVPTGASSVRVMVIGGGGGGGRVIAGGGGAGGMVESNSYPVTPGGTIPGNVGGGGGGANNRTVDGGTGSNSAFGSITAYGGGGGASWSSGSGAPGGSGGGGSNQRGIGPSNQGDFPAVNATGYGNPGYDYTGSIGGGGGGATNGGPGNRATGGNSRSNDISGSSVAYAGGGGGGGYGNPNAPGGGGGAGNGGGNGGNATNNRGSGGGGGYHPPDYNGGSGGSGIVIVAY